MAAKRKVASTPVPDVPTLVPAVKGDMVLFRSQDEGERQSHFIFGLVEDISEDGEAKTVRVLSPYCPDGVYPIKLQKWVAKADRFANVSDFVRHAPNFQKYSEALAYARAHSLPKGVEP